MFKCSFLEQKNRQQYLLFCAFQKFDIAVAALIATVGRKGLVDFVEPYFRDSGISIGNLLLIHPELINFI